MSRCVNGWDEEHDDDGNVYYRCHECHGREDDGHRKDCQWYVEDEGDDND